MRNPKYIKVKENIEDYDMEYLRPEHIELAGKVLRVDEVINNGDDQGIADRQYGCCISKIEEIIYFYNNEVHELSELEFRIMKELDDVMIYNRQEKYD